MTDKKSSGSRRKLLKSIAAGSGAIVAGKSLPESWSRPVVDSVMIPAHAQTSPAPPAARVYAGGTTVAQLSPTDNETMLAGISNVFVSKAQAGGGNGGPPVSTSDEGCASETAAGSGVFDFTFQRIEKYTNCQQDMIYQMEGVVEGGVGGSGDLDVIEWTCQDPDPTFSNIRYDIKELSNTRIVINTGIGTITIVFGGACPTFQVIASFCDGCGPGPE